MHFDVYVNRRAVYVCLVWRVGKHFSVESQANGSSGCLVRQEPEGHENPPTLWEAILHELVGLLVAHLVGVFSAEEDEAVAVGNARHAGHLYGQGSS